MHWNLRRLKALNCGSSMRDEESEDCDVLNSEEVEMHLKLSKGLLNFLLCHKSDDYLFEILLACLGSKLQDQHIQQWLYKSLGIRKNRFKERLYRWMGVIEKVPMGRPGLNDDTKQIIFNLWLRESIVTVDRMNGRDFVTMPLSKFRIRYDSMNYNNCDSFIIDTNRRGVEIIKSLRMITTATLDEIKKMLNEQGVSVSICTIWNLKPYFVEYPSEREKVSCMCVDCLNARELFNAVQGHTGRYGLHTFSSISEYFMHSCTCEKSLNGYFKLECVEGRCDGCQIEPFPYTFTENTVVKYYQFDRKATGKFNKKGKITYRTARVDYNINFGEVKEKLDSMAMDYLLH